MVADVICCFFTEGRKLDSELSVRAILKYYKIEQKWIPLISQLFFPILLSNLNFAFKGPFVRYTKSHFQMGKKETTLAQWEDGALMMKTSQSLHLHARSTNDSSETPAGAAIIKQISTVINLNWLTGILDQLLIPHPGSCDMVMAVRQVGCFMIKASWPLVFGRTKEKVPLESNYQTLNVCLLAHYQHQLKLFCLQTDR